MSKFTPKKFYEIDPSLNKGTVTLLSSRDSQYMATLAMSKIY